jgi:hypothetical protein
LQRRSPVTGSSPVQHIHNLSRDRYVSPWGVYTVFPKFCVSSQFASRQDKQNKSLPQERILWQCGKCKIFGNDSNTSIRRNEDKIINLSNGCYHRVQHLSRYALFWGITQRRMVILYRRFGTAYPSHLQDSRSLRSFFVCFVGFLTLEDGTDELSRNVGKRLPFDAA